MVEGGPVAGLVVVAVAKIVVTGGKVVLDTGEPANNFQNHFLQIHILQIHFLQIHNLQILLL